MRLNDHQLLQRVEHRYVIADEATGEEIVLTAEALARLHIATRYFADHDPDLVDAIQQAKNGRCPAGLILAGTYYRCEEPAPHQGIPHRSAHAEAVWGEPT